MLAVLPRGRAPGLASSRPLAGGATIAADSELLSVAGVTRLEDQSNPYALRANFSSIGSATVYTTTNGSRSRITPFVWAYTGTVTTSNSLAPFTLGPTGVFTTPVFWVRATLTLTESSPYAHVVGDHVYYNTAVPGVGVFTVTAQVTATAGITSVVFPTTTSSGVVHSLSGVSVTAGYSQGYTFTVADNFSATTGVVATDVNGVADTASFVVLTDTQGPEAEISAPQRVTTTSIPVSWGATDAGAGLDH